MIRLNLSSFLTKIAFYPLGHATDSRAYHSKIMMYGFRQLPNITFILRTLHISSFTFNHLDEILNVFNL